MQYGMAGNGSNEMQRPPQQGSAPQGGIDHSNSNQWQMHNAGNNQMMYNSSSTSPDQYGMPAGREDDKRNVMAGQHDMGHEWNQMSFASNENYMAPMFSGYGQPQGEVKGEAHEGGSNGYYIPPTSLGADGTLGPSPWHLSSAHEDPLQAKAERLVDFCFPAGIQESLEDQQNNAHIRSCLTTDAIRHFLDLYPNFQGHFPWLHMPTFNFQEAYDGIILVIICSGAVYSDRVSQKQVRGLMQRTKSGIGRTSRLLKTLEPGSIEARFSASGVEYEELLAITMLQTLLTWHGEPQERATAREESRKIMYLARQLNMLTLAGPDDPLAYSYLHNLGPGEQANPAQWSWSSWVEQEKRSRLMFLVFLYNVALNFYFNCAPAFSASEIKLPLPCDDAAWEATTADSCAQALGLRGVGPQSIVNVSGSLRLKQLEMHHAISALYSNSVVVQPRTTNVYSKFILIHALHTEIWQVQRQRSLADSTSSPVPGTSPAGGALAQVNNHYQSFSSALVRWKTSWDQDMQLQFPPQAPRRIGFCRDGAQFYWLARAFLHGSRAHDWKLPADVRFRQVINGLKKARDWSLTDGAQRGEEPGSVAAIDDDYGNKPLQLDMRKLFRPLRDSPMSLP